MSRPFAAHYPSRCVACDERISVDDLIRFNDDDRVVHDDCTEAAPVERPEPKACTTCWLTHPEGACDR